MKSQTKIIVSAAVALLLSSSALASPEAMSLHTKWQALTAEGTCKAKCVTAKFWNKDAMEQSRQCKAVCDDEYKTNIADNCGKVLVSLMNKGDKTQEDSMVLSEFGVDGSTPLSLQDFGKLYAEQQACGYKCYSEQDMNTCFRGCQNTFNAEVAKSQNSSYVQLDQAKVLAAFQDPVALHSYVYANKQYWACRWDCKNGKDCSKEQCTLEYNNNLSDGCGATMTKSASQLVSLLSNGPENVSQETLQTFGLTEEAPLSLHNYMTANAEYYKCTYSCLTSWCKSECLTTYNSNRNDSGAHSLVFLDQGLEAVALADKEDAPLSLHSYIIANKDFWSCRLACNGDSMCKPKCIGEYNNNLKDECGKSVTTNAKTQQAAVALHNWVEGNAAWGACKVRCTGKANASDCRTECNNQYTIDRADGKVVLANLDIMMSATPEALASIEGVDQTLAAFGLDQESPVSLSNWAYDTAAKANCKRKCNWKDTPCWTKCDDDFNEERAKDNNKVSLVSSEDFLDLYNMDAESPMSFHSWSNANFKWAQCKTSCPFQVLTSSSQCATDCSDQYNRQRADGCENKQAVVVLAATVEAPPQQEESSLITFIAALFVLISAGGVASVVMKKNRKGDIITGSYIQDKATISEKLMKEEEFAILP